MIALPNNWQPEGIAIGRGTSFYVGSLASGAVYRGDLRTGKGSMFVPGKTGRVAVGLKLDRRGRIFVAGGGTGTAIRLAPDLLSGAVAGSITDSDLDVPTTIGRFGKSLYAVNARFGTTAPPPVEYDVVKLPRKV